MNGGPRVFPVGLYATLLAALCCIAAPAVPRCLQDMLTSVQCLPLRAWAVLTAPSAPGPSPVRAEDLEFDRVMARFVRLEGIVEGDLEPVPARVVERRGRGGGGLPAELVLDVAAQDLAGAADFVTSGERLVGFLLGEADERGRARVAVLGARPPEGRRVAAVAHLRHGRYLRMLVEPTHSRESWPLRCRLFEDPYVSVREARSGDLVSTAWLEGDHLGPPAGLRVGVLRVFGYRRGARAVPIDLFVQPAADARSVSGVAVWRRRGAPAVRRMAGPWRWPARRISLPAPPPSRERWLLSAASAARLTPGAAVVAGRRLLGVVERGGRGHGIAAPLGESGRAWAWILVPDDPQRPPIELWGRLRRSDADRLVLRAAGTSDGDLPEGVLFSGANGPCSPAGLLVGPARPSDPRSAGDELVVRSPEPPRSVVEVLCPSRNGDGG